MNFYEFNQNNSGGSFDEDENICHRLLIEAENVEQATKKALALGVYFNGVAEGCDCSCCGDRWHEIWGDDDHLEFPIEFQNWRTDEPVILNDIVEYAQYYADEYGWTTPDARIFYADGTTKEIFIKGKRA